VPPEPDDGCEGGTTPPLCGSTWPPLLPLPPRVPGVCWGVAGVAVPPEDGVAGVADGAAALGVAPPLGAAVAVVVLPRFFFFRSPGATAWPLGSGGAGGWIVCVLDLGPPPPLEATAITTIRKKTATAAATSLRRR
jgi:hypothetical protein